MTSILSNLLSNSMMVKMHILGCPLTIIVVGYSLSLLTFSSCSATSSAVKPFSSNVVTLAPANSNADTMSA